MKSNQILLPLYLAHIRPPTVVQLKVPGEAVLDDMMPSFSLLYDIQVSRVMSTQTSKFYYTY